MKQKYASLFGMLGFGLLTITLVIAFLGYGSPVRIVDNNHQAVSCCTGFLEAVSGNDLETAQTFLYSAPSLTIQPQDSMGACLWDAYLETMDWSLDGGLYAADGAVCQDVAITALDLPRLLPTIRTDAQQFAETLVDQRVDIETIFSEDGSYHPRFSQKVISQIIRPILDRPDSKHQQTITLHLTSLNGTWQIIPKQELYGFLYAGLAD